MNNVTIQGRKGGSASSSYTPVEQSDDLLSDAKLKMLVAVCEGETEGTVTAQQIYLNDTQLANEDGTYNFTGVSWEFRNGTQDQEYIQGMPEIDNELSVGVAVTTSSAWTHEFTNTSLDAVRIKLSLPAQYQYKDNGDMVGTVTEYAIDLSTDGGSYETVVSGKFDGKTTSEYQRDHRINLTKGATTWAIRVRRITADSTSTKLVNAFKVYSYAEVIDSKLRYPNTALLYVEVDAEQFTSGAPKVTVKMKGKLIRVPDNYDPDTREYTGTWDGSFKMAYSNNPAWVFYDIILDKVSGMGNRIDSSMIDKWELYQIAEYCDEMVSDGASGKEPRFTCNAYVQSQEDAFTVLQDFAAIFRGITFWGNSQVVVTADAPVDDLEWTYTAANVVDGSFSYAGGSYKNRYTSCLVSYSDPQNHYSDTTEAVYDSDLLSRYGVQQTSLTAIGCTSQSEAHRRGRWTLLSNAKDGTVSFSVGLDGHIPLPASIIGVADPYRAGKDNGGRISSVSSLSITLDRAITFGSGDRLIVNLPDGTAQTRTISSISDDKKTVTVSTAFKTAPVAGAVWIIDSDNLAVQQFRVTSITDNDDGTFTIAGVQYDPNKYSYIDDGVTVESAPITVTPASVMSAPSNITVSEVDHISQGLTVATMQVAWDKVDGAINYTAQWRKDSGDWVNVGLTSAQGFSVQGIYSGVYDVRVRSINASDVSSPWGYADSVSLTGKVGEPGTPTSLLATDDVVWDINLTWGFPDGSGDTAYTELQVATTADGQNPQQLTMIAYPGSNYQHGPMPAGARRWYRARLIDKIGNKGEWTDFAAGQVSSDASDILGYIAGQITKTELGSDLLAEIDAKADQTNVDSQISDAKTSAEADIASAKQQASDDLATAKSDLTSSINDETTAREAAVTAEASARADAILNEQNAREADISTVKTLIQNGDDSLAQQIAQVAAGTGDQFDSLDIWYFDDKTDEGWTCNGGSISVSSDGWMTPAVSTDSYIISPAVDFASSSYRFMKLRLKKVGSPTWNGQLRWAASGTSFSDTDMVTLAEPDWDANGIATITFEEIDWTDVTTIGKVRLDMISASTRDNYVSFDWIAIGRPTPGAGMAALQAEQTARVTADAAEAINRETLATQLRGPYTGTDASQVTSGLIYSEQQLRISGDKAEATARQALETKLDGSVSTIDKSLDTLNTATEANASDISSLKSSLATTDENVATKADASALSSLENTVTGQGSTISSQSQSITNLVNTATVGDNIIPNPDMLDNASGWGSGVESVTTLNGLTAAICGVAWQQYTPYVPVSPGDTVYLDFDIEAIDDLKGKDFAIYWFKATKGDSASQDWFFYTDVLAGDSAHISRTLTVPDGAYYFYVNGGSVGGKFYLWNVVATRNSKGVLANASAISNLSQTVTNQGDTIASQGKSITSLQNDVSGKADSSALDSLKSTVTKQGDSITSQGDSITSLQNAVSGKADNSALSALQSTVSNQGDTISSQQSSITSLQAAVTQGSNIVPNPAMLGNTGWSANSYGTDGDRTYVQGDWEWAPGSGSFSVTAGDVLLVSADLWVDSSAEVILRIRFDGPSMSNNAIAAVDIDSPTANTWFTAAGKVTVPEGATSGQLQVDHHSTSARLSNPSVTVQVVSLDAFSTLQGTVTKQGDAITSQGQSITSLQNSLSDKASVSSVSSLSQTVTQQSDAITANTQKIDDITQAIGDNEAESANLISATLTNALSSVDETSRQIVNFGSASARIDQLNTTVADQNSATASTLNELSSSIDDNTAALQTKATTNFTAAGIGYSQFTVTAGVTYNGVYFSAGMGIGVQINSDGSATSQVLFVADRFAILSDEGGSPSSPFVVQNGQIFMSNTFIEDGTITNAKIGDTIQSNDYNGTVGWRISKTDGFFLGSSSSSGYSKMTADGFGCYDASGVERAFIGKLS